MAKRKKKSGGGAFGGAAKPGGSGRLYDLGGESLDLDRPSYSSDQSMKLIQKAIMSQGIQTPEDLEKFLNERLVGKPLDELAEEFGSEEPKTDLDRADSLMDRLAEDASAEEIRGTAEIALKLSPYCIAAWLALEMLEEDPAKALDLCAEGIEKGRVRFDGLIESLEEGQGIWGWIEARDFMRLLHARAYRLEETGDIENAIEAYNEMLTLNPGDNQGVRKDLLRMLMIFRQIDDARELLDRFPNDSTIDMAYGRAIVSIVETVNRTGYEIPPEDSIDRTNSPSAMAKKLGSDFDGAMQTLKHAVKINPFVPWMMREPQIMGVEIEDLVTFGGPFEAVHYAQRWAAIWYASGLPMVLMLAHYPSNPNRLVKSKMYAEELADVVDQAESLDDISWWEKFDHPET